MLITRPIVQRLSPSIREAQPQTGDDIVRVPSIFHFTGIPPEPIRRIQDSTNATLLSTSSALSVTRQLPASSAADAFNMCRLSPGWWEIFFSISYTSTYVTTTANDFELTLGDETGVIALCTLIAQLAGAQHIEKRVSLMIPSNIGSGGLIGFILQATAAAQTHGASVDMQCNKLL